jgi:hypothetical protein
MGRMTFAYHPLTGNRRIIMSHHHDHDHSNGHADDHHHDHAHPTHDTLSFEEKMIKLLEHWIKHNEDHADSYRDWAQKAQAKGMPDAGALLGEVAEMTADITGKFEETLAALKK